MAKKRAVGIDEKAYGPEPTFNPGDTPVEGAARQVAWGRAADWYNYFNKSKDHIPYILKYAQEELKYSKDKIRQLKLLKDYELGKLGHQVRLFYRGFEYTKSELLRLKKDYAELYEKSKDLKDQKVDDKLKVEKPKVSPHQRLIEKVHGTIGEDFDRLIDSWIEGDYSTKFDTFKLFKKHDLKGASVEVFRSMVMPYFGEFKDAYDKTCDQAVEAYAHIKKTNLNKMLKCVESILEDCDSLKASAKATRTPRVKKPKASEKQVEKLKYCKESIENKLTSINPVMIPGSMRLYTFNIKTRKLTELVTTSVNGFEVSGSSIKNFDPDKSRTTTLRKPTDIIPQVLKKTPNQIDKVWLSLTTKTTTANGRINGDTILLRALDR